MNFELTQPCEKCPFRTDIPPFLTKERICDLEQGLIGKQATFTCHMTNDYSEDGDGVETDKSQHCAGALILLEKLEAPNQMMRIAERLNYYNYKKLKMDSNVFDTFEEMEEAQIE